MNKGLISGLVLFCIGIVCGALLALTNFFTEPIIHENTLKEIKATIETFFPDIDQYNFSTEEKSDGTVAYYLKNKTTEAIYGAVYNVSAVAYKGDVNMLIAVDANQKVKEYSFVGNTGTEGFGIILDMVDFGMKDKPISNWAQDFDGYAGATITSIGYGDGGVRRCFELTANWVLVDFGGAN